MPSCDELLPFRCSDEFAPLNMIYSCILPELQELCKGYHLKMFQKTDVQTFLLGVTFRLLFGQKLFYPFTGWVVGQIIEIMRTQDTKRYVAILNSEREKRP